MSAQPGELRGRIRAWRRGRSEVPWSEVLTDAYIAVFGVVVGGSMLVAALSRAGATVAACSSASCLTARTVSPVIAILAWVAATAAVARLLGPVLVSPAASALVLAAPVDRGGWLRLQHDLAVLGTAAAGSLVVGATTALSGWPLTTATAAVAAAAVLVAATYGASVRAQLAAGSRWQWTWVAAALVLVGALVAVPLGAFDDVAPPGSPWWWAAPAVLGVVAAPVVTGSRRRLADLRRRDLVRGHGVSQGLTGALAGLDLALAYDVVIGHAAKQRSVVLPRRGGLRGPAALLRADAVRLLRSPLRVLPLIAVTAVPFALERVGGGSLGVLAAVAVGWVGALPLGVGARVLARTPALGRLLGHPAWSLRLAVAGVPGLLLLGYGLAVTPALPGSEVVVGLAVGAGAWASWARWLTGRPPDYLRPLAATSMGAVPTNLYGSVARGFDVTALVSIPLLFRPDPAGAGVSAVLSGLVLAVLLVRR